MMALANDATIFFIARSIVQAEATVNKYLRNLVMATVQHVLLDCIQNEL